MYGLHIQSRAVFSLWISLFKHQSFFYRTFSAFEHSIGQSDCYNGGTSLFATNFSTITNDTRDSELHGPRQCGDLVCLRGQRIAAHNHSTETHERRGYQVTTNANSAQNIGK
jgi:hypothetical protein